MADTNSSPRSSLLSITATLFSAVAFLLSWSAEFGCKFISFVSTSGFKDPVRINFGIWYYQAWTIATSVNGSVIFETCHRYPSTVEIDSAWKAARAFSTLTVIIGGVLLFSTLISACVSPEKRNLTKSEGVGYILCCLFQGLSLLLLNSGVCKDNGLVETLKASMPLIDLDFDDTCSISTGARCAIAATVFYFLAGVASIQADKAEKQEQGNGSDVTEPFIPRENL
jgi:hypothetical protein